MSLSKRILLGLVAGLFVGLFLGEKASFLELPAKGFVQLLQVTVLPYVVTSLVAGIAGGTPAQARRLASRGGLPLALLWALSLALVFLSPLALLADRGGFFFATADVASEPRIDWLDLYIPSNPFRSPPTTWCRRWSSSRSSSASPFSGSRARSGSSVPLASSTTRCRAGSLLVKLTPYGLFAFTAVTVTNLHSLASSATWIAGWTSNRVTNTTNEYSDYMVSGTFTTHASNRQAGTINIYILAALNDTPTWTAASSGTIGTEGALAFADTYRRDSLARLLWSIQVDNTVSAIYTFPPLGIAQLFNGRTPTHWAVYVAQNASTTTTAGLASSGSAIYYTPVEDQYT